MALYHKDERILDETEANEKGRYSELTVCQCNLGEDHLHFESKEAYTRADMTNRVKCMQYGKPIPTGDVVPPYFAELPMWEREVNDNQPIRNK